MVDAAAGTSGAQLALHPDHLVAGPGSASFVAADTATQGAWSPAYGGDGYALAGGPSSLPSYATATVAANVYTWAGATPDPRALAGPAGAPPAGLAAAWYSTTAFSVDLHLTDGQAHRVALYALDWDNYGGGRRETVTVTDDATGLILDTEPLTSFQSGVYLVWTLKGDVTVTLTDNNPGGNAVASGLFFGGPITRNPKPAPSGSASFVAADTATQGAWSPAYGGDGYALAGGPSSLPSYATATVAANVYTWAGTTPDPPRPPAATPRRPRRRLVLDHRLLRRPPPDRRPGAPGRPLRARLGQLRRRPAGDRHRHRRRHRPDPRYRNPHLLPERRLPRLDPQGGRDGHPHRQQPRRKRRRQRTLLRRPDYAEPRARAERQRLVRRRGHRHPGGVVARLRRRRLRAGRRPVVAPPTPPPPSPPTSTPGPARRRPPRLAGPAGAPPPASPPPGTRPPPSPSTST